MSVSTQTGSPPRQRTDSTRLKWAGLFRTPEPPAVRTRQRRAAITLAVGVVVMLAIQLPLGWAIHSDRIPLRDPLYLDKFTTLRAHPGFAPTNSGRALKVVFIGSSRTLNAIDAGAVGTMLTQRLARPVESFNFAVHGAGPVTNTVYLRRLLADGVKPDAVVIEVHPVFLTTQFPPPEVLWLSALRLRTEELPLVRQLGFPAATPGAHGCRGWLLPGYEYRTPMIERYANRLALHPYPLGSLPLGNEHGFLRCREVSAAERKKILELSRRQYVHYLPDYWPGGCGVAAVRDSLETCRTAGIRAALVLTPESTEFRNWYPEPGRSRIVPVLGELTREFGVPLIDSREWLADELIGDGHHLIGTGADLYTARLTRQVLVPWLSGRESGGAP